MPPYEMPDKIDAAFVQGLVERKQPENRHFEFKEKLNVKSDRDVRKMLERAAAFANTEGGFLIYGIEEFEGKANEICGIDCDQNDDALKQSIGSLVRSWVDPELTDEDVDPVTMQDGKRVLVIHVPKSKSSPHMVTHSKINRIYKRNSSGIYPPGLEELKRMFLESELFQSASARETIDEIREFRKARLDSIYKGETSVAINEGPKLVLHIVPSNFGKAQNNIDLSQMGSGYSFAFDEIYKGNEKYYYISVSQDRCFEFACRLVTMNEYINSTSDKENAINALDIEGAILYWCMSEVFIYFTLMKQGASLYFMLSLLNVEGFKLELTEIVKFELHSVDFNAYKDPQPIRQRDLIVPEFLVEDPEASIEFLQNALRPAIDRMWRASGWPRSKKLRHRR